MSLYSQYLDNQGRPIHKWAHYFPIYERHFSAFRDRSIVLIEIGMGYGGSAQMWKRYFGPLARIVAIDIQPKCQELADEQVAVRIGHQADPSFLEHVLAEFGPPDIVVDDGSHRMADVRASFAILYPRMARDAVYLVEDLHTAYWEEFGGGLLEPGTFIEYAKTLTDKLHARHGRGAVLSDPIADVTRGVHFYDSVVVVEKGQFVSRGQAVIPRPEGHVD